MGTVARRSGFCVKTLRFYERRGLLPAAGRSPGGFRLYTEADLHRLDFIRQAKALGLTLDQIRELVVTARERTCAMTRPVLLRLLDERVRQTKRQIEALGHLKAELERWRRALTRRPLTDHGRGYCACFEEGVPAA
ncbi:MAG: MerR family transcriptional regulator [Candidatus Rokubacteria bacterium]|nr:MerR family transcriptional regulator [Candidatus Rokubacteria bacterium]